MNRVILTSIIILYTLTLSAQNLSEQKQVTATNPSLPDLATVLKGVVRTSDGKPAANVNVILKDSKFATTTSELGEYYFYNLPEGRYTIVVSFTGLKTVQSEFELRKGEVKQYDFTLYENQQQLEEIVIKAFNNINTKAVAVGKMNIKPMDLPQAIASVNETVIKEQQAQRLSDVVKNVNGVYLGTARASTQESFYARGYSFSSTNMFKNGSRVNSGVMPEVSSLETVEILKGGAAVLYGNVSPGGVLNMVTKKPKFTFGGEVSMRAGSFDLWKPNIDIYGPLNKKIAYRFNGTFESANSYRDQVSSTRYYINPSFLFKLGNKTELIVEGDYLKHDFTPDFGIGSLDNTKIPDVPRSRFMGTSWQYNVTQQATASATLKHVFNNDWQLNSVISYQDFDRDYYSVERIQAKANGDWGRPLGRVDTKEKYYTAQVNLNGKFTTGKVEHNMLAGVDADHYLTETYNYDIQGKIYDSINILNPFKFVQRTDIPVATKITFVETPVNRVGVYVQDLINITSKIKLLAGIRWSMQETVPPTTTYLLKDSVAKGIIQSDNAFSPRVGILYRMKPNVSFFASYSNSFAINTGLDVYNNVLPPSIIDQFEVGVKNIFLKGKLTVNVTAYKIINSNLAQTAQFDKDGNPNSNSSLKELSGQTTSNGVELDVTSNPVKGLTVLAGYSYNDMRYTRTPDKIGSYIEGDRLVNTPAHTANASTFYTISKGSLTGLKFGAAVFYVGKRFGGWNNTVGQSQNYSRMIPVSAFTTVDVTAGYNWKKFSLLAKVSNLANVLNYYVHENYSINPIPPRSFVATLSYRF